MKNPHILVVVIFWNGRISHTSQLFRNGLAAEAAGTALSDDLTTSTRSVYWRIFPEKI